MVATKAPKVIGPQEGPQTAFLASSADIVGYGGAAGGGKTFAALLEGLRHVGNPLFGGVIFRRTSKDIRNQGGLWDSSTALYSLTGAKAREQTLDWTFPSGASIQFAGLQYESDVYDWQGAQICYLAFEEATHFTEKQFWYLVSRNRSICGVRPYIRLTFNPDPDSWVFSLFGPWVDPQHPRFGARYGEVLWFLRVDGEIVWVPAGTEFAKSITFIRADVYDNKILLQSDPGYLANLKAQDPDEQSRLLRGEWSRTESKGALWKREWIERDRVTRDQCPEFSRVVVAVDPPIKSSDDADEAGIVVVAYGRDRQFYTLADLSGHYRPSEWATVAIDAYEKYGAARIVAEKNQGGEMVEHTIHSVKKVPVHLVHASKGKEVRAQPVSVVAEAGKDHHVGTFRALEGEMTRWIPGGGMKSPNRLDAKVYAFYDLDPTLSEVKATPSTPDAQRWSSTKREDGRSASPNPWARTS